MSLPVIAIVGRPNVGKSTIFNRLTGTRRALVLAQPGITRDRQYMNVDWDGFAFRLLDTAGLELDFQDALQEKMTNQSFKAIEEADLIILVMDGRAGITPMDAEWMQKMRPLPKPKILAINKIDSENLEASVGEFYGLGIEDTVPVSAETGRGVSALLDCIVEKLKEGGAVKQETEEELKQEPADVSFRMALIGRPNVGKSTLLNRLLGEERSIVDPTPGTTRDPVNTYLNYQNQILQIIDTAGIRKKGKTDEAIEKFSVIKSLKSIERCHCALALLDGVEGITEQDSHVIGHALEKEKALLILVNKWDEGQKKWNEKEFEEHVELRLRAALFAPLVYISAKTGKNCEKVLPWVMKLKDQYEKRIPTAELNKVFEQIVFHHPLPVHRGRDIKIYYVTQISVRPPTFVVFANEPRHIHFSYQRYLENAIREAFGFKDIPLRILFRKK
jgi:GTP-binding protein